MRIRTYAFLLAAGLGLAGPAVAGGPKEIAEDEKTLTAASVKTDGDSLLELFRHRTLSPDEKGKVEALIKQLGATAFKAREQATSALIGRGPVVLELLRQAQKSSDLEVA